RMRTATSDGSTSRTVVEGNTVRPPSSAPGAASGQPTRLDIGHVVAVRQRRGQAPNLQTLPRRASTQPFPACCYVMANGRSARSSAASRQPPAVSHQPLAIRLAFFISLLDGSPLTPHAERFPVNHYESLHHERRFHVRAQANPLALTFDVLPVDLAPARQ